MSFFGNSNIGIYAYANDKILILPPGIKKEDVNEITSILGTIPIEVKIAGTILNGIFIAGNNNAIILPRILYDEELEYLKRQIKEHGVDIGVLVSESKYTALGNLILCNNRGCIISILIEDNEARKISDVLGVEVIKSRLVNVDVPGSVAVTTDHGGVIHPDASENDLKLIREITKVNVEYATVNAGIPYVKSGLIANNKGVVVGGNTTGPEVLRIKIGFEGERSERRS